MELLRVPPFPNTIDIVVSSPDTSFNYTIEDLADHSIISGTAVSNSLSKITLALPSEYDSSFVITVDNSDIYINLTRPYVDPNTKGATASEIAEYAKNEQVARAIIDSVITEGFYYKKKIVETTGLGTDYLPIWVDGKKVLKVLENNVLVWDADNAENYATAYRLSDNKTAVVQEYADVINRYESLPIVLPGSISDYENVTYYYKGFPKSWDYTVTLAVGHPVVPADIVTATEMLIEDVSCGKLDYYKRYISQYNTDQFRIQFAKELFEGTGNIIVDKILSKYKKSIRTIGVL